MATTSTADQMQAKAIISLTESGSTALRMLRTETELPIYALTQHQRTRRRMTLCRDHYPIAFSPRHACTVARVGLLPGRTGVLAKGDRVRITKGDFTGPEGTNAMKIVGGGEI